MENESKYKKILVVGGSYQGKLEFVFKKFGMKSEQVISSEDFLIENLKGIEKGNIIINQFHLIMKDWIERGRKPERLVEWILEKNNIKVIISDEIGSGLVPMNKKDRYYREETGRALCKLAEQSEEVYRVQCGIANRIKG